MDDLAHDQSLTFVMPAWNEQEGIRRSVAAAIEAGELLVGSGDVSSFEVVVVDDGSTDRTADILAELSRDDDRIRCERHELNRGLGAAIRTGLGAARGDFVLYTDADLPFDLTETHKAFRLVRHYGADVVSAYRHDRTGEGPRRAVYSVLYNTLIRVVFGLRIRDVNFAAKLIRREVLDAIELRSEGSFIDVEILAKANANGFRVVQFGVDYFPRSRGTSTLSSAPVIARMLKEMMALHRDIKRSTPVAVTP